MIDDVSDITEHYNQFLEGEKTRLIRHQLERDITWRFLDRYLPPAGSILEIGAATGGYTLDLAQRGYQVTAVDLSPVLLAESRRILEQASLESRVQYQVADARDLSSVVGKDYDAVMVMGPLYHLTEQADRILALEQACSQLRSGGVLFSSFISRYGIMGDIMKKQTAWIEDQVDIRSLLEHGKRPDDYPRGGFRGYFARVEEIIPLHEAVGLDPLVLAGIEPGISADDESYNRLEGRQRELWLDLLFEISTQPSIVGASRHLLFVGRKR
jgi:SAM-dependent methyltransferase